MKQDHPTITGSKRRSILSLGVFTAVGLLIGRFFGRTARRNREETVRLITADGQLVEVSRKHLRRSSKGGKVSNSRLKSWMEKGRQRFPGHGKPENNSHG